MTTDPLGPAPPFRSRRELRIALTRWVRQDLLLILVLLVGATALFGALYSAVDGAIRRWTDRDLERRSALVWRALGPDLEVAGDDELMSRFEALAQDERLLGIVACWGNGRSVASREAGASVKCNSEVVARSRATTAATTSERLRGGRLLVVAHRTRLWSSARPAREPAER